MTMVATGLDNVAGVPATQGQGHEIQRAVQAALVQNRAADSARRAQAASGIGSTDRSEQSSPERDPDGRQLWESPPAPIHSPRDRLLTPTPATDPTGIRGTHIDFAG